MADLLTDLQRHPQHFDLFQAIHLLEAAEPRRVPVGCGVGTDEAVHLAADVNLAFAPSDIADVRRTTRPGPCWTLHTRAMSLAGGEGPLATPFTEQLLEQRSQRNRAGLDFLDIFNGRLTGFWYRARGKHNLALQRREGSKWSQSRGRGMAPLAWTVDAISGVGSARGVDGPAGEMCWLRHASLQNGSPRSMASLLALLRDRFGLRFEGEQFVGAWHELRPDEHARLHGVAARRAGFHARGMSLGRRAWDQGAGIALSAPPLAPARFAELLPDSPRLRLLAWLVAQHLQGNFRVILTLTLAGPPVTRLGIAQALPPRLGRSAWLCSRASRGKDRIGTSTTGVDNCNADVHYRAVRFLLPVYTVDLTKRR